jgi:uncharacterized protein YqgV (UPF0045/DUF77 family)
MRVIAELSLYPLQDGYIEKIESAIVALRAEPALEIVVNQMSTQVRGELGDVLGAIERVLAASFDGGKPQVLIAKILNADLPISEVPAV